MDRGKNNRNLRTNSLQPSKNDASQFYPFLVRPVLRKKNKIISSVFDIGLRQKGSTISSF
jgi:hypothetical protein